LALTLYNTINRRKQPFEALQPPKVTMYVCGPTVYSYPHIGNARPAVVFDVLASLLRRSYDLKYARNITDVDDKINAAAQAQGVDIGEIAQHFADVYAEDMQALGVAPPDIEPRVTDHMDAIIRLIGELVDKGNAYEAEGHVLFSVGSFEAYGRLSNRSRDEMLAGARVEIAPYKQDPGDFVLWKPSDAATVGWDSPWGRGRPGWHIECSAMARAELDTSIDIHGGGQDLIFPHHENEIAQSTCANGALYARYWVHNGFVNMETEKMSKSLGNVLLVRDLLQQAPGEAIRLGLLSAHYRQPLNWTAQLLREAKKRLDGFYGVLKNAGLGAAAGAADEVPDSVLGALEDDLNTPQALSELSDLAGQANRATDAAEQRQLAQMLRAGGGMLGLLREDPQSWFQGRSLHSSGNGKATVTDDPVRIDALIAEREQHRQQRDFEAADRIRNQLEADGIVIEDGADGATWRRK
jgi:cysteinyl-tRNA synthetase